MLESRITRVEQSIARDYPRGYDAAEIAHRNGFTVGEVKDVMRRLELINADVTPPKRLGHLTLVEVTAAAEKRVLDLAEEASKRRHPAGGSDA